MAATRVGILGGVPRALGGGGLEIQVDRTTEALRRRGLDARPVGDFAADEPVEILHGFHAEPHVWHLLPHWTRSPGRLVLSPVLPVAVGREERLLKLSARWPGPVTTGRMRREAFQVADAIVALTQHERGLAQRVFGAPGERIAVVGNGVEPVVPAAELPPEWDLPDEPFLLMVGNVSTRKRQADVVRAVGGTHPVVLVGGFLGSAAEEREFRALVADSGARWIGEVRDPTLVRGLQARAAALVLISSAEALSLAVLESLAAGTPVIASDLPSHRELSEAHPGWVGLVDGPEGVPATASTLLAAPPTGPAQAIASWDDVAAELAALYDRVLDAPRVAR